MAVYAFYGVFYYRFKLNGTELRFGPETYRIVLLSFFSEIIESERRGRLSFFLADNACHDKNDNRNDVRKKLHESFDVIRHADVVGQNIQRAEKNRTDNAEIGFPQRENNERDGKPAHSLYGA